MTIYPMKPCSSHFRKLAAVYVLVLYSAIHVIGGENDGKPSQGKVPNVEAKKSDSPVAHRFRWTQWGDDESTEAFMDELSLGKGKAAAEKLAAMQFPKGSVLQVEFPKMPPGALTGFDEKGPVTPYFRKQGFLRKWILQGVRIDFVANGKPHEIHTLTALDGLGKPAEPLAIDRFYANGPGGTFLFDGRKIESSEGVIEEMAEAPWSNGSVLMICSPEDAPDRFGGRIRYNGIVPVMRFLEGRGVITIDLGFGSF